MPREITEETPYKSITIGGFPFNVAIPYSEGDEMLANEANALNQTRCENVRNNMASTVEDEKEKAKAEAREVDLIMLQKAITDYDGIYEFGVRSGGGRTGDPVETEAMDVSRGIVRESLKKKGIKLTDIGAAKITELARGVLDKYPQIRAQARATVEARKTSVADIEVNL